MGKLQTAVTLMTFIQIPTQNIQKHLLILFRGKNTGIKRAPELDLKIILFNPAAAAANPYPFNNFRAIKIHIEIYRFFPGILLCNTQG